jgi:hypothetical protein
VYVSDGDVYVAGFYYRYFFSWPVAVLWKNGERIDLDEGRSRESKATSVFVSNGNVYVAGYTGQSEGGRPYLATVWKNGEPTYLGETGPWPCSLFVKGDDVYLAGGEDAVEYDDGDPTFYPTVWKNGEPTHLKPGTRNSRMPLYYHATSVFVDDNDDVYVTGWKYDYYLAAPGSAFPGGRAILWKNGEETVLSGPISRICYSDRVPTAVAKSVKVVGGDVYVAGSDENDWGTFEAVLWVNGERRVLAQEGFPWSEAHSVFVKEKAF